jgi:hypothetical protein
MEKKKKIIKAWVVLDGGGVLYAEENKPQGSVFMGSGRHALVENCKIVPCTITYSL